MAIERRAVKKRILKSGKDRTDTAVYVLLKYGVTDDADVAQKLVQSNDEVLFPSDLSYYTDQVDQDLGMGKTSPEVEKIRNALAEFYGLYEPEQETEEEIPSELDDLLGSIREEDLEEPAAPPSSALAIYEGVGGEDIVEEDIDERILKLLKLDGVYDIDYATYMTLLKERMVAARMADSSISTEEDELLRDEFKRVKGKVGRFKLKKKRITAEDLGETGPVTVSDDQFFLTSSAVIPKKSADPEAGEDDSEILKKLDDILTSIRMENKEEKKKTKADKKDAEAEKRRKKEKKLETQKKKEFKSLITNVVAPVTSFLEKIINWIKWTFIGFIFNQALAWFQDPANQNKVTAIGNFLKTFFPAILAAAVLFLTPFGGFIRGTIKLFRWAIPKLLGIIKKNPKLFAAAALVGAGAIIPQLFPETVNEQERKTANAPGSKDEKIAALKKQKENLNPLQILQGVGSEIDEQIKFLETGESASYGAAPGGRVQTSGGGGASNADNKDLDEMPTIEGMSGGGEVGTTINNYGLYNGGGLIQNTGGQFNNYNTLDSQGTFNPVFGFTGGGINLPNVNIPSMKTNISLMSGGGATSSMLNVNDIRFSGGGGVTGDTGVDVTGAGPDTQLVALQPGEIVMSKGSVNYWGANTLLGMNKAGGGTNVPKMANNIQMATGGGMVGSTLDPTKTAASMPNVFKAAKAARAQARAEGLSPEEVEKRVVAASEKAKAAGPSASVQVSASFGATESPFHGPATPGDSDYSSMDSAPSTVPSSSYSVPGPITANPEQKKISSEMIKTNYADKLVRAGASSIRRGTSNDIAKESLPSVVTSKDIGMEPQNMFQKISMSLKNMTAPKATATTASGSRPTTPFKSARLNKALTGIKPGSWKKRSQQSKMDYSSAIKSPNLKSELSSSMQPVPKPVGNTKPNIIKLPEKTTTVAPPMQSKPSTPEIPKFSSKKKTGKRGATLSALGISDLVG